MYKGQPKKPTLTLKPELVRETHLNSGKRKTLSLNLEPMKRTLALIPEPKKNHFALEPEPVKEKRPGPKTRAIALLGCSLRGTEQNAAALALSQRVTGLLHPSGRSSPTTSQLQASPDIPTSQGIFPSRAGPLQLQASPNCSTTAAPKNQLLSYKQGSEKNSTAL